MTTDPRTIALGADRWLTDSRAYNLVWLGRWIERAQDVGRALLWAARRSGEDAGAFEDSLTMVAAVRGLTPAAGETTLEALLLRDGGASFRGCLAAARCPPSTTCTSASKNRGSTRRRCRRKRFTGGLYSSSRGRGGLTSLSPRAREGSIGAVRPASSGEFIPARTGGLRRYYDGLRRV